jgi:hypothetical protein
LKRSKINKRKLKEDYTRRGQQRKKEEGKERSGQ